MYTYRFICENTFLFLLGKYPGMGLLDHIVTLILRNCRTVFQSGSTVLHSHLKAVTFEARL